MSEFSTNLANNCGNYSPVHTHRQADAQTGLIPRVKIFSPELTEYNECDYETSEENYFACTKPRTEKNNTEKKTDRKQAYKDIYMKHC